MMRDPEWFEKEMDDLLEKWYKEDTQLDFSEYREKHMSTKAKRYLRKTMAYIEKMRKKGILVG